MSEREAILGRVREALRIPAPLPGHGERKGSREFSRWLPPVGDSLEAFRAASAELRTDFRLVDSPEAALAELRAAEGWKKIATHRGELTTPACASLGLPVLTVDSGYDVQDLEACDAGVTECDALVAQTGTVVLTSRQAGGRALSVLPPHHVVLARRAQLLPDLPAAFALLKERYGANYPSMIALITGPSRTGDIERILVLGAHGPKKLTIFCL